MIINPSKRSLNKSYPGAGQWIRILPCSRGLLFKFRLYQDSASQDLEVAVDKFVVQAVDHHLNNLKRDKPYNSSNFVMCSLMEYEDGKLSISRELYAQSVREQQLMFKPFFHIEVMEESSTIRNNGIFTATEQTVVKFHLSGQILPRSPIIFSDGKKILVSWRDQTYSAYDFIEDLKKKAYQDKLDTVPRITTGNMTMVNDQLSLLAESLGVNYTPLTEVWTRPSQVQAVDEITTTVKLKRG
jgi:hypothetical protein